MTLLFRVEIADEVHQVKVAVPPGHSKSQLEALQEFVLTTAWLEHYGHLPRGVVNALD